MELDEAMAAVARLAGGPVREPNPKALNELYASLPRMKCIGECASSCGEVELSPLERARIEAHGVDWVAGWTLHLPGRQNSLSTACSALDQTRLVCRVYEDRPMICRIWGLIKALECPWGCAPEGGHMDDIEGLRLVNAALWYGGSALAVDPSQWNLLVAQPEVRRVMLRQFAKPVKEEAQFVQATIRRRPGR